MCWNPNVAPGYNLITSRPSHSMTSTDQMFECVRAYVHNCVSRESPPRVQELADCLGISRMTLTRWFRDTLQMTPAAFLRMECVSRAASLLDRTSLSTTAIAYRTAFGTRRTFYRAFRRHTAMTPAQFRKRLARNVRAS